ncbi:MAG: prepilin-type N-terminal cleavage/methylation domain-containing protein [Gammaproteobacteria bacterium]
MRSRHLFIQLARQSGFTLLELLLVLTIIGMASILVVPNLGNLETRTFGAQVREAVSLLNYARRIAVVNGNPSTASFVVTDASDAGPVARNSVGRWQSYGSSIRYRDSTDREIDVEGKIEVTFYPEGGSTGGTLLMSQEDQFISIYIDPFTGRVDATYVDENGDPIED